MKPSPLLSALRRWRANRFGRNVAASAVLTVILLSVSGCVSRMFYYPDRTMYQTPADQQLAFEPVNFASADGTPLTGWFVPATNGAARGTVVHFHGNAQNMTAHYSYVDWLSRRGFNVFVFDYRGYGASAGRPDREGVFQDSVAALRYVRTRTDLDPDRLLVFGQSLGGANAIAAVVETEGAGVRAVAIDSAFYSYRRIVRDKIKEIPGFSLFRWPLSFLLIGNAHSPGPVVDRLSPIPLLFLHGRADPVIPSSHSERLHESARPPKELILIDGAGHTEAMTMRPMRERLVEFFEAALEGAGGEREVIRGK